MSVRTLPAWGMPCPTPLIQAGPAPHMPVDRAGIHPKQLGHSVLGPSTTVKVMNARILFCGQQVHFGLFWEISPPPSQWVVWPRPGWVNSLLSHPSVGIHRTAQQVHPAFWLSRVVT